MALHRFFVALLLATSLCKLPATAQTLSLPPRPPTALTGSQLATNPILLSPDLLTRETFIEKEIRSGNVPNSLRQLRPVTLTDLGAGGTNIATLYVIPTYLALGSDADYLLLPLTPTTAQRIADATGCLLPTRKMVDAIHAAAAIKLTPQPLPPDERMTTVPVFVQHNQIIRTQLVMHGASPGALIAGHKKDVVLTSRLATATNKVAIYGWHRPNGVPIQPLYLGHAATWVDYSHGIRLVSHQMRLNGQPTNLAAVLADPILCSLLSDEGVITHPRYSKNFLPIAKPTPNPSQEGNNPERTRPLAPLLGGAGGGFANQPKTSALLDRWPHGFTSSKHFGELTRELHLANGVRVLINTPAEIRATRNATDGNRAGAPVSRPGALGDDDRFTPGRRPALPATERSDPATKPLLLVCYALPNGNTIEWTSGKKLQPDDDLHYDRQHIGAQTRFLRDIMTNQTIVVAYLENSLKSWPAWRREHGNAAIPPLLSVVRDLFADFEPDLVLTGHSGGGSLTLGYLSAVETIPRDIKRIAFLDSNYAYETTNHLAKLIAWFRASAQTKLCVLAYHDSSALLDGKTFVSESGGTWGRSHVMLADLRREFPFTSTTNDAGLQTHVAIGGRIQLLLQENPDRQILHTIQVERNGFIHALLTGTPLENHGYEYFGERAYERWIQGD